MWEGDSVERMPQVLNLGFTGRVMLGKNHSGLCLRAKGDSRTGLFSQGGRLSNTRSLAAEKPLPSWWSRRAAEQGLKHLGQGSFQI